jgi:hypothetical protein
VFIGKRSFSITFFSAEVTARVIVSHQHDRIGAILGYGRHARGRSATIRYSQRCMTAGSRYGINGLILERPHGGYPFAAARHSFASALFPGCPV